MEEIERIKSILKNSQAVIFYWKTTKGWPVEYVSENVSMFGYQSQEFISGSRLYSSIIHPDDLKYVSEEVEAYTQLGKNEFRQVYRLIDIDGNTRWVDDRTVIQRDENNHPLHYVGTIIDITEQKNAEQHNLLLGNVIDNSGDEVYVFERGLLRFTYLNLAAINNIGYSLEEARQLTPFDINGELNESEFTDLLTSLLVKNEAATTVSFETLLKRKDGTIYPGEVKLQSMEVDGRMQFVAMVRDITKQKRLQAQKEEEQHFVQSVIDGVVDSVMVIDKNYNVTTMNKAARTKLDLQYVKNHSQPKCYEVSHHRDTPCDGVDHPCPLKIALDAQKTITLIHNHGHDGVNSYVEITATPLINKEGLASSIVESSHDITKLIETQEELIHQSALMSYEATHDDLTGLANRRLFDDRLEQAIFRAKRMEAQLAVAIVDVDKFKHINDTYGHMAGDEVIKTVAKRLKNGLRRSDTVARLGGDEFAIVLESIKNVDDLNVVMNKLVSAFTTPMKIDQHGEERVTVSIGVCIYKQDQITAPGLIKQADLALYKVKNEGRNGFCFYDQL